MIGRRLRVIEHTEYVRRTYGNTRRFLASAQIALDGFLSRWIYIDDSIRTSAHAGLAARAFFRVDGDDLKLLVKHNRIKSAGCLARWILTLLAGDRHIDTGRDLLHPDARPMRVKRPMVFQ
jgi:hypothetical protein